MPSHRPSHPTQALEALIDRYGLSAGLSAIAEICDLKAEHIAVNWQDCHLAKSWADAAHKVEAVHIANL